MTDDERRDLQAEENAVLRGLLHQTARWLKQYQDAPAFEIEETPALEVIVPASLREGAGEVLQKPHTMLKGKGRTR
jgi:hypothetical protein